MKAITYQMDVYSIHVCVTLSIKHNSGENNFQLKMRQKFFSVRLSYVKFMQFEIGLLAGQISMATSVKVHQGTIL